MYPQILPRAGGPVGLSNSIFAKSVAATLCRRKSQHRRELVLAIDAMAAIVGSLLSRMNCDTCESLKTNGYIGKNYDDFT